MLGRITITFLSKVLTDLSSENLDAMLTMLENVTKDDLSPIVSVLDKVNMNKLEQSIEINKDILLYILKTSL